MSRFQMSLYSQEKHITEYENQANWFLITGVLALFLIICLWIMFTSFNHRNVFLLIIVGVLMGGVIRFNEEIYQKWQYIKCVETSNVECKNK